MSVSDKSKKVTPKKGRDFYKVVEWIGDIPIKTTNIISVYIPQHEMVQIAHIVNNTNLSVAKVLSASATPCEHCKGTCVILEINGEKIFIPRGLLVFKKGNSGTNISKKKRKP